MEPGLEPAAHPDDAMSALEPATRASVLQRAATVHLPAGTVLFRPGDLCLQFPIILSGTVRVYRIGRSGKEMLLYRVTAGQTCIMTTTCLLASDMYAAGGTVEEDVRAVLVSVAQFSELMNRSADFRRMVFRGYSTRIMDLMQRIEALCDVPVDVRLAARLLETCGADGVVATTHQSLASEIGTAREVVSRSLERLEHAGLVRLARGHVEVIDRFRLSAVARPD